MAVTPQIKANQLAKDLNVKSKDMVDLMAEKGIELKAQKALEPHEFDVLFDAITSMHQIDGIDDYIDGVTYSPSKLEKAAKPEKTEEKAEVKVEAADQKVEEKIEKKVEKKPPERASEEIVTDKKTEKTEKTEKVEKKTEPKTEDEGGCGSTVGFGALAVICLAGAGLISFRKKED